MSATLELPKQASPREQIQSWTDEEKEQVFLALLDELLAENPVEAFIPINADDGIDRGHIVTPRGAQWYFEKYGPQLTQEDRDYFAKYPSGRGKAHTAEEVISAMKAAVAASSP